jgi:lipopolysaccharide export system permease protein
MAATGQVLDNNGQPQIVIFNGRRQEMDEATGKLSELGFDQYVLDLNALRAAAAPRLPDPREETVDELLHPSPDMLKFRTTREHLMAELHQRLAIPLLVLSFTLIGLAAILAGEFNRRGLTQRMLTATVAIIVTQATFMSMAGMIAHRIWMAFMLYLVAVAPMMACISLLNFNSWRYTPPPTSDDKVTEP